MLKRDVERQRRKMVGLCGGDRVLAARLLGTVASAPDASESPRIASGAESHDVLPWDIDWSDCALAQRYGVR